MEKIKMVTTLFVVTTIILTTFSTIVYSKNEKDTVTVEIYNVRAFSVKKKELKISVNKVNELKHALTELSDAIDRGDVKNIKSLEKRLATLGVVLNGLYSGLTSQDDNISNHLCYFQAIGSGDVILPVIFMIIEKINERLKNVSSLAEALAVIIAMIILYVPLIIIAYLIPFKIFAPMIEVRMASGRMRTIGAEGSKSIKVDENPLSVEVKGFTGIVVNIPQDNESFFFVSGLAVSVNEKPI
ncbi:MAG: hypothetical protein J7K38_05685 [Thermoplasmata archaeon]|nr:hypothetical protein [Thermoplasmata archaeon]